MKRSTGITASAVLVFIGSGFTLLIAFMVALVFMLLQTSRAGHTLPKSLGWFGVLFYGALSAWGIATGVALLRLREWGRISQLVFSAFLAVSGLVGAFVMLFIDFPTPRNDANPALTHQIVPFVKFGTVAFYAALGMLGVGWLYYFSQRSIRAQFGAPHDFVSPPPAFAVPDGTPVGSFVVPPPATTPSRPVSISIIAVFMLLGAAVLPMNLLYGAPLLFFGFMISGWRAVLLAGSMSAVSLAAGIGLFKLKLWARTLAIGFAIFGLLNSLITVVIPGSQSRWDQAMQSILEKWAIPTNTPMPHFPLWLSLAPVIPVVLVELYFLITRKPAFLPRPDAP
jgi:hypothetical protein